MTSNNVQFLTGFTPTGDLEHDSVATTLLALEAEVEEKLGWDAPALLFQISAVTTGPMTMVRLTPVPVERWLPDGELRSPAEQLLEFARSLDGPEKFNKRAFADTPEGRCGFVFVTEAWMVKTPAAEPTPRGRLAAHPQRVEVRVLAATDVGGREYWVQRERGAGARYLAGATMTERIPAALWTLTAALTSGRFEL